jgi:endonuclease YncB( thermonuclease family)
MSEHHLHFTLSSFWIISALIVSPALAQEIIGEAGKVVDGDTMYVCDTIACHKIRLCGIDAPEKGDIRYKS